MPSFLGSPAAAYILLPLAAACWSGNHVIARAIAGHVPPASLSVVRWVIVVLILAPFARAYLKADWARLKEKAGAMVFLALMGGAAFGTLQYVALQYTTALNMGVVGSVAPCFIVAASFLLFGDRLGPVQLFGVGVSLLGVLTIVTRLNPEQLLGLTFNGGDLIIIANMMFWSTYCACLRLRPEVHPITFLLAVAVISAIGTLPFAVWEYALGFRLLPDRMTVSAALYAALFTTVLAYGAWNRGVDLIGAPRASAFLHTVPVFSMVLATTFLGEQLRLYHVVGFVLILAGVTLAARPVPNQMAPPTDRRAARAPGGA